MHIQFIGLPLCTHHDIYCTNVYVGAYMYVLHYDEGCFSMCSHYEDSFAILTNPECVYCHGDHCLSVCSKLKDDLEAAIDKVITHNMKILFRCDLELFKSITTIFLKEYILLLIDELREMKMYSDVDRLIMDNFDIIYCTSVVPDDLRKFIRV